MSSLYVRNLAETFMAALTTPYYNTVNEQQNPPAPWVTLDFITFDTLKETFCDDTEEIGTIRLLFYGAPGVSFATLFAIAEADADLFYNSTDPSGALTLEVKNAALQFGGSDTPFFGVEISIDYSYRP